MVLNRNFLATEIAEWQRVMALVYDDKADVVDQDYNVYSFGEWAELSSAMAESPNGFVHTTSLRIAIPDVIKLRKFERLPSRLMQMTRNNVYEHYGHKCGYCGKRFGRDMLNLDHVMPRSRGGQSDWLNIMLACVPCNNRKANKTPEEAGMTLLVKPSRPQWRGPVGLHLPSPVPVRETWQRFIDSAYWNSPLET